MKIIDLSADVSDHMLRYPSQYLPEVQLVPAATHQEHGRSAHVLTMGTHISTHVDAPFHAISNGITIDKIPLSVLLGPAHVIRLGERDKSRPISRIDLEECGDLNKYERLILDTCWAKRKWGTLKYFTEGPFLDPDAALFLATLPRLQLLGMDFPNIDSTCDTKMGKPAPNHQTLLGRGIILIENLLRLSEVEDDFLLSANPIRLVGADGCPTRAVAISPLSAVQDWLNNALHRDF